MSTSERERVPAACTLPTVERPLRLAEFDALLARALRAQRRPGPTRLRWRLDPAAEETARDLARRESSCCSFFTFTFSTAGRALDVTVDVPAEHVDVLDALEARAAARMPA